MKFLQDMSVRELIASLSQVEDAIRQARTPALLSTGSAPSSQDATA